MPVGVPSANGNGSALSSGNHTLKSFIERLERLNAEQAALRADASEVLKEAKACGFDPKIIRSVLKYRATSDHEREMAMAGLTNYLNLLGQAPSAASLAAAVAGVGSASSSVETEE